MNDAELARLHDLLARNRSICASKGRQTWPSYLYFQAPLQHSVNILREGLLFSRNEAIARGLLVHDCASAEVIAQSQRAHQYARLYWRPKTPTYYVWEGIKSADEEQKNKAHLPMPLIFRFAAAELLARPDVQFTSGNLARGSTVVQQGIDKLEAVNFGDVFHVGAFDPASKDRILNSRSAEVLFDMALSLDSLRDIVARSAPERDTLLGALPHSIREQWKSRIIFETRSDTLFHSDRFYVKQISYTGSEIYISFSGTRSVEYDFAVTIWKAKDPDPIAEWTCTWVPSGPLKLDATNLPERVRVRLTVNGHIAFDAPVSAQQLYTSVAI